MTKKIETKRGELNEKIDKFLATYRKSRGGGWASIERSDIDELHDIIRGLLELKMDTDADGDLSIDWDLIDRTRYESSPFQPVPYNHQSSVMRDKGIPEATPDEVLERAMMNMSIAVGRVDTLLKIRRFEKKA